LLDYDGTLAAYEKAPNTNNSTKRLVELLTRLTSDSRNVVYVMSGRTSESLEQQLGEVPNLGMRYAFKVLFRFFFFVIKDLFNIYVYILKKNK